MHCLLQPGWSALVQLLNRPLVIPSNFVENYVHKYVGLPSCQALALCQSPNFMEENPVVHHRLKLTVHFKNNFIPGLGCLCPSGASGAWLSFNGQEAVCTVVPIPALKEAMNKY